MADPYRPQPWKYEPQSVRRAREVSSFRRLNDEVAPLVARGDSLSLYRAQQRVQAAQWREDAEARMRSRSEQRQRTSQEVRKRLDNPPSEAEGGSFLGGLAGGAADAFRAVVPRGVRDALSAGGVDLGNALSATAGRAGLPGFEGDPSRGEGQWRQSGTRIAEGLGRSPVLGKQLATAFDVGASPLSIASAGLGAPAVGALRAAGPAGKLAANVLAVPGKTYGGRLGAQALAGVTGQEVGEAGRAGAEALGLPEWAQTGAGIAGGFAGGAAGFGLAGAAMPTWKALASQRIEESLRAAAPEAFEYGRGVADIEPQGPPGSRRARSMAALPEDLTPRRGAAAVIAGGAEHDKQLRDVIAKRQKGESSIQTPEQRAELMNQLGEAWGATTEAERAAAFERPEGPVTDALTEARRREAIAANLQRVMQESGATPTQGGMLGVPDQLQARPENMPAEQQGQMFDREKYRAGFKKAKKTVPGAPPPVPKFPLFGEEGIKGGAPLPGEPGYVAPGNLSARIPREQWIDPRELQVRPDLFQARDVAPGQSSDPRRVKQIVENFNPERFDPITVVRDPEGNPIVIAGHHRTAAALELGPERMPEVPIREISGDISTPEGRATLQNEAALSNFRDAPSNPREQYNTARTLEQNGQTVDEIAPQMRMTANKVQDILDIGAAGDIVMDRVVQSPPTAHIAAAIGRAVRQWKSIDPETAYGLYERFTKKGKGESLLSAPAVWAQLEKLAPALAEQPVMPGFGGLDLGPAHTQMLDAVDRAARLQEQLIKTERQVRGEIRSVEAAAKRTGIDAETLIAASRQELEAVRSRLQNVEAEVVTHMREGAEEAAARPVQEGPGLFGEQPAAPAAAPPEVVRPAAGQQVQLVRPSRPGARVEPGPMRLPEMGRPRPPENVPEYPEGYSNQPRLERLPEPPLNVANPRAGYVAQPRLERLPEPPLNVMNPRPEGYYNQPGLEPGQGPPENVPQYREGYSSQPPMEPPPPPPTISGEQPEFSDYGRMAELPASLEGDPAETFRQQAAAKPGDVGIWNKIVEVLNLPRTLIFGGDPSNLLRQEAMIAPANPREWWHSVEQQFAAMKSEEGLQASDMVIKSHPDYPLAKKAGLYLAPIESAAAMGAREEQFAGARLAQKFPLLGPFIRTMERGFVGGLNTMRAEVFYKEVAALRQAGVPLADKQLEAIAGFLNAASGRGNIPQWAEQYKGVLNAGMVAPRNLIGRVEAHTYLANPLARKVAAKNLAAFYGAGMSMLAVGAALGLPVEVDPRSSDFGKLQLPNGQRIDFWAGNQQIFRAMAQLAMIPIPGEEAKSARTGELYSQSWQDTMGRFLRSKLAPLPALGVDLAVGGDFRGEELSLEPRQNIERAVAMITPSFAFDAYEAMRDRGLVAAGVAGVGSAFGLGVGTYARGEGDVEAEAQYGKPYARLTSAEKTALTSANPELPRQILEQQSKLLGPGGKAAEFRIAERNEQEASDRQFLDRKITRQEWNNQRQDREARLHAQVEAQYGVRAEDISAQDAQGDPLKLWLRARANAKDPATGVIDQGIFEREKATWTPEQVNAVNKSFGQYDTDLERLRRSVANKYYALPEYKGFTASEARQIDDAWNQVRAGAQSADELDMRRSLRRVRSEGGDVPPRIWTGVQKRIAQNLPKATDRKRMADRDPLARVFFGGEQRDADWQAVQQALGAEAA